VARDRCEVKGVAFHGTCHEQAVALCEGSYETQNIGNTAPGVGSYNGQIFMTPANRLLLIACNR
jgi:hypothetical protein